MSSEPRPRQSHCWLSPTGAGAIGERAGHYAEIFQRYTDLIGRRNALLAARERAPGEVRHDVALAELYLEAGQPETAETWLREARRVRPRDSRRDALTARISRMRKSGSHAPLLPVP